MCCWYDMLFVARRPNDQSRAKLSALVAAVVFPNGLLLCCLFLGSAAWAQLSPEQQFDQEFQQIQKRQDEIFRQRQREQLPARPDVRLDPGVDPTSDEIPENETPCFVISEIRLIAIDGGEQSEAAAEEFQWALKQILYPRRWYGGRSDQSSLLGKCYGVQGINAIMRRLQNVIVERGYVTTRVVAGPQDLNSGVLVLTVIPGRIREIQSDRNTYLLPLKRGDVLNLRHIEQALENLKSLPSVQTDIRIVPAKGENVKPGESDLVILWQQGRPWRMGLSVDDSGSETTGESQGNLFFSFDDLANLNDALSITFGHDLGKAGPGDGGTDSYSIRYSVPVRNWSLSLSASENEFFQTIEGAFTDTRYRGESQNTSVDLSRLVYRDQRRRLIAGVTAWTRESKNFLEDVEVNNQRREAEGYRINLNYRDFIGRSVFNANLSYHQATQMEDQSLTLLTDDEDPTPAWLTADINIDVPLTFAGAPVRYFGQIRYQDNFDPLSSQDYFTIGNRYNVRTGNNSSSLSAEKGWMIRNDFETSRLVSWAILYFGLDYGEVSGESFQPEWERLSAKTIGFKGRLKGVSYDLSVMSAISAPDGFRDTEDQVQFSLNYQF